MIVFAAGCLHKVNGDSLHSAASCTWCQQHPSTAWMISEEANMLKKVAHQCFESNRQLLKTIGRIGIRPIPTCDKNAAALRIPIRPPEATFHP